MCIIGLLAVGVSLSACSLNATETLTPEVAAIPTSDTATSAALPTTEVPPSITPVTPIETGSDGCVITMTGWPAYTIAAGDMLSELARRVGSTVAELSEANCIADADAIAVGQTVFVPRLPPPPTIVGATLTPEFVSPMQIPRVGSINASSSLSGDGGSYLLLRGETITVSWPEGPADAAYVEFYVYEPGWTIDRAGPNSITIGRDSSGADGWSLEWTVPPDLSGQLAAFAYRANGGVFSYVDFSPSVFSASGNCRLSPANGTLNLYGEFLIEETSTAVGQLNVGESLPMVGRSLNGSYALDPVTDGQPTVEQLVWARVDADVNLTGDC